MIQRCPSATRLYQRTAFPDMGLADDNLRTDAFSHSAPVYYVGPNFFSDTFLAANMDYIFFRQSGSEFIFFAYRYTRPVVSGGASVRVPCQAPPCDWSYNTPGVRDTNKHRQRRTTAL